MAGVDPLKYVIGFERLEDGPPTVEEFPSDNDRNDDGDVACEPRRLAITFGKVRMFGPGPVEEVHLQLLTEENGATYYAYSDDSYAYASKLWRRPLFCAQNPELDAFTSWL